MSVKITIVVKLVFWHHRVHYSDDFHSSTVFIQIKHTIHINSENLVNLTLRKPPLIIIIDFGLIQFSTILDEASWLSQSVYFMATKNNFQKKELSHNVLHWRLKDFLLLQLYTPSIILISLLDTTEANSSLSPKNFMSEFIAMHDRKNSNYLIYMH